LRRKIILIIKELGRVLARLNALKSDHYDEELINEIAALIAEKHAQRAKVPLTFNIKNERSKNNTAKKEYSSGVFK
jgi:hypothetical protein